MEIWKLSSAYKFCLLYKFPVQNIYICIQYIFHNAFHNVLLDEIIQKSNFSLRTALLRDYTDLSSHASFAKRSRK